MSLEESVELNEALNFFSVKEVSDLNQLLYRYAQELKKPNRGPVADKFEKVANGCDIDFSSYHGVEAIGDKSDNIFININTDGAPCNIAKFIRALKDNKLSKTAERIETAYNAALNACKAFADKTAKETKEKRLANLAKGWETNAKNQAIFFDELVDMITPEALGWVYANMTDIIGNVYEAKFDDHFKEYSWVKSVKDLVNAGVLTTTDVIYDDDGNLAIRTQTDTLTVVFNRNVTTADLPQCIVDIVNKAPQFKQKADGSNTKLEAHVTAGKLQNNWLVRVLIYHGFTFGSKADQSLERIESMLPSSAKLDFEAGLQGVVGKQQSAVGDYGDSLIAAYAEVAAADATDNDEDDN